jgi:hypothetical protein
MQEGTALRLYGVETTAGEATARGLLVAQTPAARRGSILRNRYIGRRTLSGLTGFQTYLFAPLLRDDDPDFDGILDSLAHYLRDERPRWEMIELAAMDGDARSYGGLLRALGTAGYVVRSYPHYLAIFEPTPGKNYAAYLASRPPSARKQIKNYERKERQLSNRYSYRSELISGPAGLEQALKDYAAVLEASWKEKDFHPEFLPACIRASAEAGALRLLTIYLDDKPAATQFVLISGNSALFYRTAYDPAFARDSVGALVHLLIIQHVLDKDQGIEELDFGRDREAFKQTWASNERARLGLIAFDTRTLGGLRGLLEQQLFELRDWIGRASRPLRARLQELRDRRQAQPEKPKAEKSG